jgi:hypothetical protein
MEIHQGALRLGQSDTVLADLQTASQIFERRFFFNALLPTAVFVPASSAGALACFGNLRPLLSSIVQLSTLQQILILLALLALVWLLARIVASGTRGIVRLYEGYSLQAIWSSMPLLSRHPCPGIKWHYSRQIAFNSSDATNLYTFYSQPTDPQKIDVLPTRFGNILRASERYPVTRYSIDPIIFWPRLFPLLPEQFRADYGEFVDAYEFSIVLSFLTLVSAAVLGLIMILTIQPWYVFALTIGLGWTGSVAFYRGACSGGIEYGEQLRTAFDVYRGELLALYPAVESIADDRDKFKAIKDIILFGYVTAVPPSE